MELISISSTALFAFLIFIILQLSVINGGEVSQQQQSTACGIKFGAKCSCGVTVYNYRKQYVVNCTNAAFTNTTVLEYMPSDVEVLIFTGNYLETLPWNIFGTDNDYPKLRIIDMSNNHIREIHGKTFHHVQNVERLILNHNNISISPTEDEANFLHPRLFSNFFNLKELHLTNAFADNTSPALSKDLHSIFDKSNLTQLIKLHLEQNEIVNFSDRNVFCELRELEDLHLSDNNLDEINFNVLCLNKLRFLDLERNRFETVKQHDLDLLNVLEKVVDHLTVDFSLNPFTCNCTVYPFVNWIRSTKVSIRFTDNLMCHTNERNKVRLLEQPFTNCRLISHAQFDGTGHRVALFTFLAFLIFLIFGLVVGIVYLSKERIKNFVSPVISSRKVYYTTIKDDEVHEVIV